MNLTLTLSLCAAVSALGLAAGWLGARPPDPRRGPRLIPYRFLTLLALAVLLYLAAHVLSLLGLNTGQ